MITADVLQNIGSRLQEGPISEQVVSELRGDYPDHHFTYCMDDDVVSARPVFEGEAFNLYLVDSSNHCPCFTQDMEIATGIVVAEVEVE